jgi:high frequency lysogenization protein
MKRIREKTIALAGVFQSAALVQHIAVKGTVDEHDLQTTIRSTLNLNPSSVEAVFGNLENLRTGIYTMWQQLGNQTSQRNINVARYVITMLHLQKKLSKRPAMLNTIAEGLKRANQQADMFGITHANVIANLAGIYSDTISLIPPKIMITGDASYLSNTVNADKIRAILLGGVRSAVLWSQVGGARWQILFKRRVYQEEAKRLMDSELTKNLH